MRILSTLLATAFATLAAAQSVVVDHYVLPNGLRVTLHQDHAMPVVSVNLWYYVGSKDEPEHRSGFAHLFEHLMFMGTHRVPQGQFDKIMEAGGGDNNASTMEDRTNFYDWGPANLLPTLLWLEADRLEDLGNSIDQKKLDLQRNVVENERRQNTENTPYGRAYEAINGLMFPTGHPYHTSVIGSMQDLENASVQDVQTFFATYYVPNNGSLVVSGDFNASQIKPLISKLFGTLLRKNDVPRKSVPNPQFAGVKRVTYVDSVQASRVIMRWHSPAHYQPGDAELNLAASILSDGFSSRLYQRLVVKDKLATEVSASQDDRLLGSLFCIDATAAPNASLPKLEAAIDDEVHRLATEGPTNEELQRQSAKLEYQLDEGLQSVQDTADQLNEFLFYMGRADGYSTLLHNYRNVTQQGLKAVVAQNLEPNSRLILQVVPQTLASTGANPRDQRPTMTAIPAFSAPMPAQFTLSNGLRVMYWQRASVPLMDLSLLFKVGADADPSNRTGLDAMTASLMSEGAGSYSGKQFQEALDSLGAQFSVNASELTTTVDLSVLSRNFAKALPLFSAALMHPAFSESTLQRDKGIRIASIEEEEDDPASVASKVARSQFFGANSPLGRPVVGTHEGVSSLTRADLMNWHSKLFQPKNATLYAAGALPIGEAHALLEKALGGWRNGSVKLASVPLTPPAPNPVRVVLVDRPGAVQTVIRFYFPSVSYSDPNHEALESLGTILGGTFTSRLNQNLREDKGYTYGANAEFSLFPELGYLTAGADVRSDVTGASLQEFLKEFKRIRMGDVTTAEAASAASSRRAEAISSLGSLSGLIGDAEGYSEKNRPFSDFTLDLKAISGVSAEKLNAIAASGVNLDNALIILVGDKQSILKQLQGLGLPQPIEVKG